MCIIVHLPSACFQRLCPRKKRRRP